MPPRGSSQRRAGNVSSFRSEIEDVNDDVQISSIRNVTSIVDSSSNQGRRSRRAVTTRYSSTVEKASMSTTPRVVIAERTASAMDPPLYDLPGDTEPTNDAPEIFIADYLEETEGPSKKRKRVSSAFACRSFQLYR